MTTPTETEQAAPRCFIIMPMAPTVERYPQEHFQRVLAELIQPACEKAGFTPIYAKTSGASEIIMADVLRQLIETEYGRVRHELPKSQRVLRTWASPSVRQASRDNQG